MNHAANDHDAPVAQVMNAQGKAALVLVCEHASCFIPQQLEDLGLTGDVLRSHVAWDPGADAVSQRMAGLMDAPLVVSGVSRLVYDCNRPPNAPDATPARSEVFDIPGNADLTPAQRQDRAETYYKPFQTRLRQTVAKKNSPALVTIHSFTPVYNGEPRDVEIGLLHDTDACLADAMLAVAAGHTQLSVQRNAPYGPQDGVTHTLKEHALPQRLPNVMIEIRNDLIATPEAQDAMAKTLSSWVADALSRLKGSRCKA